jgi:hypothetical protein
MTQDPSSPQTGPASTEPETGPPQPPAVPPRSGRSSGLPSWLPLVLLAVVPALLVALVVYVLAGNDNGGGGGGDSTAAAIVDGFIRLGPSSDAKVTTYQGKLPDDFPGEFSLYKGTKPLVSFAVQSSEDTNYFVIFRTPDSPTKVYNYYLEQLDKDVWQIEVARSSDEFTGVRFNRPDNPDVEGDVTIHRSDIGKDTAVYVSITDSSKKSGGSSSDKPFVLGESKPLPPGFPNEIPVYKGKNNADSIVTDTYLERGQGGRSFIVSFLTKDSQDDVLSFYRGEFEKRGWQVMNSPSSQNRGFRLSIDFSDPKNQQLSGSVRADAFDQDPSYTKVDLLLQMSGTRGRGN